MSKQKNSDVKSTKVTIPTPDGDLNFTVLPQDAIDYINGMLPNDKYNASFNFITSTVDDDSAERVMEMVEDPYTTMALFNAVFETCGSTHQLGAAVKK